MRQRFFAAHIARRPRDDVRIVTVRHGARGASNRWDRSGLKRQEIVQRRNRVTLNRGKSGSCSEQYFPDALKSVAKLRRWRETHGSVRVQEGEPPKIKHLANIG